MTAPCAEATRTVPATPGEAMSRGERTGLVLVLGALIALGPLTIDMYLPALPAITDALLTTPAAVQLTLTGTLLGIGVGQLVIGPLSDAYGRRRPLLAGVSVHVLASLLAALAPTVAALGALRVVQGFGAAAASVVAMAVVRDLFSGRAAAVMFSRLMLVMGAAPVLAPSLGSALLTWTEWRGIFAALAVLGAVLVTLGALALPETLPPARRRRDASPAGTVRAYATLLRDRTFVGLMLVAGLVMSSLFAYVAGSSFVFQEQYGLDEQQFGVVFSSGAVGLIAATQLNARLLNRYQPQQMVLAGLATGTVSASVLVTVAATGIGGLPGLLVPLWAVLFSLGLTMPNVPALALSRHGEAAGTAAALLGSVQFGLGAVTSPLVGLLGTDSRAMATVIAAGLVLALCVLAVVVRPWRADGSGPVPVDAYAAAH